MTTKVQEVMTPPRGPSAPGEPTPGIAVLGWLLAAFAIVPLAMAAKGTGGPYGWIGSGTMLIGVSLIVAARLRRHRS